MSIKTLILTLGLTSLYVPAFATPNEEVCTIRVDIDALAQSIGTDLTSVRVTFIFGPGWASRTVGISIPPNELTTVTRPGQGSWVYLQEIKSDLLHRNLDSVKIESDGWSLSIRHFDDADNEKGFNAISCTRPST